MSKAELQIELRQLRKEHLQGGNAVSKMSLAELRTEVAAIRRLGGNKERYPSLERTMGRPSARPIHNTTVEDADEDGEGIQTPVVPEKKVIIKDAKKAHATPEHMAKMREVRDAKKAEKAEKKELEALIKGPEMPSKSGAKKMCFCNCPSCPHK
jgi:hypothetical protein